MLLLVSGATSFPRNQQVGHLIVPKSWNDPATLQLQPGQWAMDNGCFNGLDEGAFMRMLEAYQPYQGSQPSHGSHCRFVSVPDVVGDAASTLRRWAFWSKVVRGLGWPLAFVAQNGITPDRVPWDEMACLFIGGDNTFKEGPLAASLCAYAKSIGLWVHWGRVNGLRRYKLAVQAGADSIDGTGFSMYPDVNIPKVDTWQQQMSDQPSLQW